jgi:hypothetical protein
MSNATAKHYTVGEIAALWGVSRYMVRRIFGNLPGVIKLGNTSTTKKARGYVTLSIPESIVEAQHAKLAGGTR